MRRVQRDATAGQNMVHPKHGAPKESPDPTVIPPPFGGHSDARTTQSHCATATQNTRSLVGDGSNRSGEVVAPLPLKWENEKNRCSLKSHSPTSVHTPPQRPRLYSMQRQHDQAAHVMHRRGTYQQVALELGGPRLLFCRLGEWQLVRPEAWLEAE